MPKKQKAGGGKPFGSGKVAAPTESSKLTIRDWQDVADSEDEFHINRDKIQLEEDTGRKRKRDQEDQDLELSDEEVYSEVNDDEDEVDEEDNEQDIEEASIPEDEDDGEQRPQDDDEFAKGWGSTTADYYNADAIQTEADALEEEQEALRLQRKQLEGFTDADYGFDEMTWAAPTEDSATTQPESGKDPLVGMADVANMDQTERSRYLTAHYPEFMPFSEELVALSWDLETLAIEAKAAQEIRAVRSNKGGSETSIRPPLACIKHAALSGYMATLTMYFALLASGQKSADGVVSIREASKLRDHPIMDTLLRSKSTWDKVKDLEVIEESETSQPSDEDSGVDTSTRPGTTSVVAESTAGQGPEKPKRKRESRAEKAARAALAKVNAERARRAQEDEQYLQSLSEVKSSTTPHVPIRFVDQSADAEFHGDEGDVFGNSNANTTRRQRDVSFYVNQIHQKAKKRANASREAGGDEDLPYKERRKDREARLNAEAEARGKRNKNKSAGDLLGEAADAEDERVAKEVRDDQDEDYYDMIAQKSASKKAAKKDSKALHELKKTTRDPAHLGLSHDELGDGGGKRGITYAIEKNKGLTPNRRKEARNPRVKKRRKYEEKMKKLGSMRAVYKGGEGRGGYGGEATGIKSNLVKSVKLG